MSMQSDLQAINSIVQRLDRNRVARLAYTETAFNENDIDGVAIFDRGREQNIPDAEHTDYNPSVHQYGIRTQGAAIPRMAWNHFIGRSSFNLNKLTQQTKELLNLLSSAARKNGFRYDAQAIYIQGDCCFDFVGDENEIAWYRRNNIVTGSPVPLTEQFWDTLVDTEALNAIVANVSNRLDNESTTMALSAAQGKILNESKAPVNAELTDEVGSNMLPALGSVPVTSLLQTVRNCLKWLVSSKAPINAELVDEDESSALPALGSVPITSLLQTIRNCLKWLVTRVGSAASLEALYYVGKSVIQYPGDLSPAEEGLPGVWSIWSHRAVAYGLVASLPSFTIYAQGANFNANVYVIHQPVGGSRRLLRARNNITNAPMEPNPIDWIVAGETGFGLTVDYVPRRQAQSLWTDPDLATGAPVDGMVVAEMIVLGGTFPSIEGINRPTFGSGTAGDVARAHAHNLISGWYHTNGTDFSHSIGQAHIFSAQRQDIGVQADTPTGPENAPRTLSVRYWRRVA